MNTQATQVAAPKAPTAMMQFRGDLAKMKSQFATALPKHIPVERFMRVVATAIQNSPALLRCERQSLFNACMKAAQDGLLPDGREGAIVPFGENEDGQTKRELATWMPMVAGLRKIARNSGEISNWESHVVRKGDRFEFRLGDDPFIRHEPTLGSEKNPIIAAYSVCWFKDGSISREVMSIGEIEEVRKRYSRAKKGPWNDTAAYPEMCRKTVARRHSKMLPKSTDLDRVLHRDDELYDLQGAKDEAAKITAQRPSTAAAALDYFGGEAEPMTIDQEADTAAEPAAPAEAKPEAKPAPRAAAEAPAGPPRDAEQYKAFAKKVIEETDKPAELGPWLKSEGQRRLRAACGVTHADLDLIETWIKSREEGGS